MPKATCVISLFGPAPVRTTRPDVLSKVAQAVLLRIFAKQGINVPSARRNDAPGSKIRSQYRSWITPLPKKAKGQCIADGRFKHISEVDQRPSAECRMGGVVHRLIEGVEGEETSAQSEARSHAISILAPPPIGAIGIGYAVQIAAGKVRHARPLKASRAGLSEYSHPRQGKSPVIEPHLPNGVSGPDPRK